MIKITAKKTKKSKRKAVKVKRTAVVPEPFESYEVTIKKKTLGDAPEEYHFVLKDGKKLRNLFELVDELETMPDHVFAHHVNEHKNDFANWVKDIFDEHDLAREIKQIEDKVEMQRALIRHLVKEVMEMKK